MYGDAEPPGADPPPDGDIRHQSIFPTALAPLLSITNRACCAPALKDTVRVSVCHDCHPPVSGMVIEPVTLAPFISRWNEPPWPEAATRTANVYEPAEVTFTEYWSHSPGAIQPTLYPPPEVLHVDVGRAHHTARVPAGRVVIADAFSSFVELLGLHRSGQRHSPGIRRSTAAGDAAGRSAGPARRGLRDDRAVIAVLSGC